MSKMYGMLLLLLLLAGFLLANVGGHDPLRRMGLKVIRPSFRNAGNRRHFVGHPSRHASPRDRYLTDDWTSFSAKSSVIMGANSSHQVTEAEEVQILLTFKAGLTGDPLGVLSSWRANGSSACHWKGVRCAPRSGSVHVVAIHLRSLGLVGTISPSLGGLTFLKHLDLSNNSFDGSIPTSFLDCARLSYLALQENRFGGEIPSELGNLIRLRTLNLSRNFLEGVIPVSIVNCSSLSHLSLGNNNLTGEIPRELGRAVHLQILSLEYNLLSGSIPGSLGNCTSLLELHLDSNFDLVGNIPPQLESLRKLQQLTAAQNILGGTLPSWIGNLTALVALMLNSNMFTGDIPDIFGDLKNLKFVNVEANNLTGKFPLSLTNCSSLTELSLRQNLLSGVLPTEIGRLQNLEILNACINMFSAHIPSSLSNCSSLTVLQLGDGLFSATEPQTVPPWLSTMVNLSGLWLFRMGLQGAVPPELAKLPNLQVLSLTGNNLTGQIPTSLGNCTNLRMLSLQQNQLTGNIPTELGSLVMVYFLTLYGNLLTGPLPTFLANFTQLQYFEVHFNNLEGNIKTDFGALSNLMKVRLYHNNFTGPIPPSLSNCSSLLYLEIANNQFGGPIPPSLGNISQLGHLDVRGNRLEGRIPIELLGCTMMTVLLLSDNFLEGSITPEYFQLSHLQVFEASNNRLSGEIPSSIGSSGSLLSLDLSYNSLSGSLPAGAFGDRSLSLSEFFLSNNLLSGPLPEQLSVLGDVVTLDLSVNNFSGSIPAGISRCTSLENLDLSFNNLTGVIPETLGDLPHLSYFNVSYNHLEGPVPDDGPFKSNISAASFLGNSGLCGNMLSTKCPPATPPDSQPRPAGNDSCQGFCCKRICLLVTCVAVGILSIGLVTCVVICWRPYRVQQNERRLRMRQDQRVIMFSNILKLKEEDIRETISNEENKIGAGGMSVVYKGTLPGGKVFAVKSLRTEPGANDEEQQAVTREHLREVDMLATLQHRNIMRVYGYFSSPDLKAIILEYLPQGSLDTHLYRGEVCELTWARRLNIALGVAEGLVYLHEYFREPIIHRDLKPSNILLDENFEPRVGDFGISKFVSPSRIGEATASTLTGTTGYMPPEYAEQDTVSTKGDVYSYGMTMLEIVTRKRPTDVNSFEGSANLVSWILKFQYRPSVLLDPAILPDESRVDSKVTLDQINLLVKVGLMCTQRAAQHRPAISDVLTMLNQIKRTGLAAANYRTVEELANEPTDWLPEYKSAQIAIAANAGNVYSSSEARKSMALDQAACPFN